MPAAMPVPELHVVTGAFGYSGRYITARLLEADHSVRTLTNSPQRANPFGGAVEARPFDFDQPTRLAESLRGAAVLYNTYWVRFTHGDFSHAGAVENTLKLFAAAKAACVRRVVHVSITNPSEDSPLPYFAGKARLERALSESRLSYAILRPAALFGTEDILINNIAWCLRRFPFFAVFGDGQYRLQPIYVDDFAELAIEEGRGTQNRIVDAIGPETFTYRELVTGIGEIIGKRRPVISLPPALAYSCGWLIGRFMGDVTVTHDEIQGLMQDLLYTASPPAGQTRFTDWAKQHAATLGVRYASELTRRRNRREAYERL
ncbi:MAG TPA: NAD(P)H-binding protein [Verrucomicrobiae bacterium]|nr:NAD(P)H-binding protein [Verrucomicrobiae bacterium]